VLLQADSSHAGLLSDERKRSLEVWAISDSALGRELMRWLSLLASLRDVP
jgi:hypothetical protein